MTETELIASIGDFLANNFAYLACIFPVDIAKQVVERLVDIGYTPDEAKSIKVWKPAGCSNCNNTGYKGRTGLFEVMEIKGEMKELVLNKAQAQEIKRIAMQNGMITLRRSGLSKIKEGITSIDEVLRETVKDEGV